VAARTGLPADRFRLTLTAGPRVRGVVFELCVELSGMQMRPAELAAIRAGDVDVAFRRWERPRVRAGTRMRTAIGLVEVMSVDRVPVKSLTAADARRAGPRGSSPDGPDRSAPEPGTPLPHLGAAATRALTARGVVRLEQVARLSAGEVEALHGAGLYALRHLRAAMDAAGLAFRDDPGTPPQT